MNTSTQKIQDQIYQLKKEKNAVILAHYYEDGAIQDIADEVGDSFYLAKKGQQSSADVILLAGVVFMAESVKILNPQKKVLVPDLNAGCSLVDGSPYKKYLEWRKQHPEALAVTYINSSAEVKAISDVIVTSSNAEQILNAIPKNRKILFGPDANLGRHFIKTLNREMILWPGMCQVHVLFSAEKLRKLINDNPDAIVISHPECDEAILMSSQVIGSTSRLLEEVQKNPAKKFIIGTETGIFHQMQKLRPDATLIQVPIEDESCSCNDCPYMKLNTLEKIKNSLTELKPQVSMPEGLINTAKISLERMMQITSGKPVVWPTNFVEPIFLDM